MESRVGRARTPVILGGAWVRLVNVNGRARKSEWIQQEDNGCSNQLGASLKANIRKVMWYDVLLSGQESQ